MVHVRDFPGYIRDQLLDLELPEFDLTPWAEGPPLARRRVALISTAGLHRRDDRRFEGYDPGYRVIPDDTPASELMISHVSTNFDRTGFYQDVNVMLPLDRLRELRDEGLFAGIASRHYSFVGAVPPGLMEPVARDLAGLLRQDRVDAVVLCPV